MGSPLQRLRPALVSLPLGLALIAVGCSDPVSEDPADLSTQPLPPVSISTTPDGAQQLAIPTFDGSGEVVEPDVVHLPNGWHGWEYWMAFNPYPHGNEYYENASIVTSHDGLGWEVPAGLANPVIPGPGLNIIHNSDPDLVYVRQLDRMVLFYRAVTQTKNVLYATSSSDGIHWNAPVGVLDAPRHSLVSPAVVLAPGRRPKLYYVDSGRDGCAARATSVVLRRWMGDLHADDALVGPHWSDPVSTDFAMPPGWLVWHLDVTWVDDRSEYWAVFPAYLAWQDCAQSDLFMARSRNGVRWEAVSEPILRRGDIPWAAGSLYRASLEYDAANHAFRVWFSGRSPGGIWHIGHQTFPVATVLDLFDRHH